MLHYHLVRNDWANARQYVVATFIFINRQWLPGHDGTYLFTTEWHERGPGCPFHKSYVLPMTRRAV